MFGLSEQDAIAVKQAFLNDYPRLGSERGLAYNRVLAEPGQQWNSLNASGLERRLARLLGISDYSRRNLATVDSGEGMYLIEDILLRPAAGQDGPFLPICVDPACTACADDDPYSYRLHFILPADVGRFPNMDFRRFVEETIRQETPAHILPKVCWANAEQMAALQTVYHNWIEPPAGTTGQELAVIDARGNRHSTTFDAAGRRTAMIDPLGRLTTATWDTAGRQTLRQDARNNVTTYSFDANGRTIRRLYPDGSLATFVFDEAVNRTKMQDSTGLYTFTFDAVDRLQVMGSPGGQLSTMSYDEVGNWISQALTPNVRLTYSYDGNNRQALELNSFGQRTTSTYDAAGKRTLLSMADGTRTSFTFDSADRLLSQYDIHANSSVKSGVDYEYDPAGNRNRMRDAAGERATWTYDDSYQLIREQRTAVTGTFDTTFTYDPVGNRTAKNALGSLTTSTYDAADQLQTAKDSSGTTTFTFDASGNQQIENAPGGITTHSWNYENQRIGIVQPSGSRVTMAYNADFFRVRKEA